MYDHAEGLDAESWGLPEEESAISWYDVMSAVNEGRFPIIINIPNYSAVYKATPTILAASSPLLSTDDERRERVITRCVHLVGLQVEAALEE